MEVRPPGVRRREHLPHAERFQLCAELSLGTVDFIQTHVANPPFR